MTMISLMFHESGIFNKKGFYHFSSSFEWGNNSLLRFFESLLLKLKFVFFLLRHKTDCVYVISSSYSGFYDKIVYIIIGKIFFKKTYLNLVGGAFFDFAFSNSLNRFLVKFCLKFPTLNIVGSDKWKKKFEGNFKRIKVEKVYNPVKIPETFIDYQYDKSNSNNIEIVFIGALVKNKGVLDIVKVIKSLNDQYNLIFTFIGKGELEPVLLRQLQAEIINNKVRIEGFISESKKLEILKRAHIFFLPSYFEVLPISILEAMFAGLVIISTKVGAISEVIKENENGFLFNPGDISGMYNQLLELSSDFPKMKKIGIKNISDSKNYSMENIINSQLKLMND